MRTVAIVQARLGSTRFPDKVMRSVQGTPLIGLLLERLRRAHCLDEIVLATTDTKRDLPLADYAESLGFRVCRGSEQDVLDRYYKAAQFARADVVFRITGDCPLVDPRLVDDAFARYRHGGYDYVSNISPPTYPDGLDVEVFSFALLERSWREAKKSGDREHVTPYMRSAEGVRMGNLAASADYSSERWTVDEPEDLELVQRVFGYFSPRRDFSWLEVIDLRQSRPDLFKVNQHIARNEGAQMGSGQKLWKRAKHVIPGGNMLLSKRAEMFLPEKWPAYFSKARGARLWDLDDNELLDMALMGVGTNTLGYAHAEIDDAVRRVVSLGNMSSLNCPEEVLLAEKLVAMHPWAEMVRLARTGGEANAIAVRIARAASGRDKVAICGYHGWHDWYLAANLAGDSSLDGHLLPGLDPKGVPANLRGTVLPFRYNEITELEALVRDQDVGVIKMEVSRNVGPNPGFLESVRRLATQHGIVLIFDECTSGFRECFGGLHLLHNVLPDVAVLSKALGNGYAISAIIGRREVMEAAQQTFISSTFWTERIGPAAALKTLEVMESIQSWKIISALGREVGERWEAIGKRFELPLQISGLPALIGFSLKSKDALKYKTLITQELLKKGILASTNFYASTAHSREDLERYFSCIEPVFELIAECEHGRSIDALLDGPVCHAGFARLN